MANKTDIRNKIFLKTYGWQLGALPENNDADC